MVATFFPLQRHGIQENVTPFFSSSFGFLSQVRLFRQSMKPRCNEAELEDHEAQAQTKKTETQSHILGFTQSLPASGSYPMSQLFAGGGQSIGVSA